MQLSEWTKGIRLKLLFMIILPTIAISLLFVISNIAFKDLSTIIKQTTTQDIPSALSLSALNSGLFTMTVNLYEAEGSQDASVRNRFLADAKEEYAGFIAESEEFKTYDMSDDEKKIFNDFLAKWDAQKKIVDEVIGHLEKGDTSTAGNILRTTYSKNIDLLDEDFSKFDDLQTSSSKQTLSFSDETINKWRVMLSIIGFSGVGIILVIGFLTATRLVKSLSEISGDLSQATQKVSSAATQIAKSSQEMSQSTTEQAAALEETASSLEEINSMILKSAENADSTAISSNTTTKKAEDGQRSMNEMLSSMKEIDLSNEAIMNQIDLSNQQMMGIITVIQ